MTDRRSLLRRLALSLAAAAAAAGAVLVTASLLRTVGGADPEVFDFGRAGFVETWNTTADELGQPGLVLPGVSWTDEEAGVFGHAWSPTLSVLGRVEGRTADVVELVVIGEPERDGEGRVRAAMEILVAVTEPSLDAEGRNSVLERLSLAGAGRPAEPDASVVSGTTRFRSSGDPLRGRIGIGATPVGS
jgi:hypothetical protein